MVEKGTVIRGTGVIGRGGAGKSEGEGMGRGEEGSENMSNREERGERL